MIRRALVLVIPVIIGGLAWRADAKSNSAISRGNVELYFNNYIVTADEVIFDQGAKTLVAQGNAQLMDPSGAITRADRMELNSDFVEGFGASLVAPEKDAASAAALAGRIDTSSPNATLG